jgi:serine/threonine protein kinase
MSAPDDTGTESGCPGHDALFAFNVGNLPAEEQAAIALHLEGCESCVALLERLGDDDSLLAELRGPLPAGAFSGAAAPPPGTPDLGDPTNLETPRRPGAGVASPGRYQPRRLHARGGLGEVHVAHDEELDRVVALKRIRAERAGDADSRRRFLLEAEITGKLEHPGVVPVYGLVRDGGEACYAMRFVQGESLKEAIDRFHAAERPGRDTGERSLALRGLLNRFVAVCNTVAYAHSRGVIHRDIKPANILLGKYGETLVVDWGLAKPFARREAERSSGEETLAPSSGGAEGETQMGQAVGTPAYMSPEQAEGRWDQVGTASDVFSLGATLYALLTGQPPFEGNNQLEVLTKARRCDFPPPRGVKCSVPAALEAVCLKAMALKPEERYASALEFAAEVEHWLGDERVAAYREPPLVRAGRWARKHRTLVTTAAGMLLVAVVGLSLGLSVVGGLNQRLESANAELTNSNANLKEALGEAERDRNIAVAVNDFLQRDLLGQADIANQPTSPTSRCWGKRRSVTRISRWRSCWTGRHRRSRASSRISR